MENMPKEYQQRNKFGYFIIRQMSFKAKNIDREK